MLITDKEEIIEAISKDIEGASASTIKWLGDSFNEPLPNDPAKQSEEVYIRVPVTVKGKRHKGRTVIVRGILIPNIEQPEEKAVTVLNIGSYSLRKKNKSSSLSKNNANSKKTNIRPSHEVSHGKSHY